MCAVNVGRRRFLGSVVGASLAATSCAPRRPGPPRGSPTEEPRRLPAVPEALWVADGTGRLRAYDGRTHQVSARVDTRLAWRGMPPTVVAGGGVIWMYAGDGRIAVVDPERARVTARVTVPTASPPGDVHVLFALGALWVAHTGGLWRVRPGGQASRIGLPIGFVPGLAAAWRDRLWLTDRGTRRLVTVAGTTATPAGQAPVDGIALLAAGRAGLFAVPGNSSRAWLIGSGATVSLPRGELIFELFAAGPDMWAIGNEGTVAVISGGRVTRTVRVSDTSQDFPSAAGLGSLWVCDEVYGQVVRVEPGSGRVSARMEVPAADPDDPAFGVLAGRHSVWLVDGDLANGVMRVDPAASRVARLAPSTGVSMGITAVVAAPPRL